jgi:hypothetical protein
LAPIVLALALVAVLPALPAFGRQPVGVVGREVSTSVVRSSVVELPLTASHVALNWRGAPSAKVTVAFSSDGATFTHDLAVEHDDRGRGGSTSASVAGAHDDRVFGGVLWTEDARFARVTSDRPIARLNVVAINANSPTKTAGPASQHSASAAVDQPDVLTRAEWAADESFRFDESGTEKWPPAFYPVQKLIVHHTAGRNDDPNPQATVRAIYYLDAITRNWGDIGYNFLIDEGGRIYEGRYSRSYDPGESPTGEDLQGNSVAGAHVLNYNSGTVGIALLGKLVNQDATPAARAALERLLAWKAERHSLDPLGTSLYTNPVSGAQKTAANISGHQDWAATECPGGTFYATFQSLRQAVATRISGNPPPEATVPQAPVLTARTPAKGKGVRLDWAAPADGGSAITGYRVLRLNSGSFTRIATLSADARAYRDTSTKRGRAYTYVVRAVNALGAGPNSNEATATAR